ncbi:conserved Plasmodium protein, unknown function [Plasmodium vivax]|uniref:indole-3-glycerol-phosphate synthase n=2 Tax=Plasmodium vivax TaxID=5855 RepID=A0A1G4HEU5_PLAVI|nr:hypothetical protein PVNG_00631 [Plasmodium vivax North Korean]CAG9477564.1 unnamed protein product [Plasmodium vivax]SCO67986.1 conserved Plasmodium protein, unknown function [Plasmodium vivax]SCO73450.1 conserved Plasmodium protein, unknown function [Plasmodium vivax]
METPKMGRFPLAIILTVAVLTMCAYSVKRAAPRQGLHILGRRKKCHFVRHPQRKDHMKSAIPKGKANVQLRIYGKDHRNPHLAYEYVNKIIENKKYEVSKLLEENFEEDNPLQIRMKYLQHTMNNKLSESLKRTSPDEKHRLSMVADMKRKIFCSVSRKEEGSHHTADEVISEEGVSQTEAVTAKDTQKGRRIWKEENYMYQNNFLNLTNPGKVSLLMHEIGFDVLIVNIDNLSAQGNLNDLCDVVRSVRKLTRNVRPAVVVDDVIIHPIQIALAVENKADGVILNLSYLKNDLEDMLNYCVNLGTQAIVEVHDYNDIYFATQCGSYILMINEFDFLNNQYEYNHAIKAISYTIPELITIAKINVDDLNYATKLGSLGYDSICLERKLVDGDLPNFVQACKSWNAPHKTLLYMNRNSYLKNFLTCTNDPSGGETHQDITDNLKKIYDDKNLQNRTSHELLKNYERDFIDAVEEGPPGQSSEPQQTQQGGRDPQETQQGGRDPQETQQGGIDPHQTGDKPNGSNPMAGEADKTKDNLLTSDEKKIVQNFKREKKRELFLLNQMKDIIKQVDDQCKNYDSFSEEENKKKEEKLETLLENFTKMDKKFLRGFFSDEEIKNIENSIKKSVQQKEKIEKGEMNIDDNPVARDMYGIPTTQGDDFDISKLTQEFFDNGSGGETRLDEGSQKLGGDSPSEESPGESSRGVDSQ